MEEETDFGDYESAGYDERAKKIVYSVGLEGEDGCLRASENDWLAEVEKHK